MFSYFLIIFLLLSYYDVLVGNCPAKPKPEDCTTYKRKQCTTTTQTLCSGKRKRKKRDIDAAKNDETEDILSRKKRTIDVALKYGKKLWNKKLNLIKGIFGGKKKNNRPTSIVQPPSPPSPPSNSYPSSSYPSSGYPSAWYPSSSYPSNNYPSISYPSSSYPSTIISSPSNNCYKVPKRTCKWVPYRQVCKKNDNCKPKPTTECKKECKNVYNCYDCPDKKPTPIR